MWKWLKEFVFSKKPAKNRMLAQKSVEETMVDKETIHRMELSLFEEIKMTFGDYSKLFKCDRLGIKSGEKANAIVTDYVDDEEIKELVIMEIGATKDVVVVNFKDLMRAGTFNIADMIRIKREVEEQIPGVNLDYSDQDQSMYVVAGLYKDYTQDQATHAAMIMHSIWEIEASLRKIMPVIRSKYGRK